MPDLDWNKATWDGAYDWSGRGHEWSGPWGGSAGMFFATILPRIGAALPADSLLEPAPGHGRVTAFLLRFCRRYRGVDLSQQCVDYCRGRFAFRPDAAFFANDGLSLPRWRRSSSIWWSPSIRWSMPICRCSRRTSPRCWRC